MHGLLYLKCRVINSLTCVLLFLFYNSFGSFAQLLGWLVCVQLIGIHWFFAGLLCGGRQKQSQKSPGRGIFFVLFVDVLNFVGVLFILVIELPVISLKQSWL